MAAWPAGATTSRGKPQRRPARLPRWWRGLPQLRHRQRRQGHLLGCGAAGHIRQSGGHGYLQQSGAAAIGHQLRHEDRWQRPVLASGAGLHRYLARPVPQHVRQRHATVHDLRRRRRAMLDAGNVPQSLPGDCSVTGPQPPVRIEGGRQHRMPGDAAPASSPAPPPATDKFRALGWNHACAIRRTNGQLATRAAARRTARLRHRPALVQVAAGNTFTCAICSDGVRLCQRTTMARRRSCN